MTTYLGQPCPIMAPFVGRYFGKRATALDRYGANLSAASLPGQGSRVLHNTLQSLLQAMMKVGGIHSEKEAVNFLIDKIGDPHITAYVNHVSSHPNAERHPTSFCLMYMHGTTLPVAKGSMTVGQHRQPRRYLKSKRTRHATAATTTTTQPPSRLSAEPGKYHSRTSGNSKNWTHSLHLMSWETAAETSPAHSRHHNVDSTEGKSFQLWQAGLEKLVETSTKSSPV